MVLDIKNRVLYKARVHYDLSPAETKIIALLSNNKLNTYDDFRRYVYKQNVSNDDIKKKLRITASRYGLYMSVNNYGSRMRSVIAIGG